MKVRKNYIIILLLLLLVPLSLPATPVAKADDGKFTVVIDAGHGGKDTGAIDNGVKEKDVNLGVALQLADLLRKKLKDVKVVMTRDNDTFLSLQERADKANKSKGDLFISIHTNSVDKSNKNRTTVAGASVYAMGLHKDQNNMKVAQRENSVIELESNYEKKYSGFDPSNDESYIIFEMAQKKNLSQSIKFANEVQKQLVNFADRKDRGVHQAGFWVLWATSMPSVLVELDFICNPNSAKFIGSEQGQKKMAEAIFNAVKTYSAPYIKTSSKGQARENVPRKTRSVDEMLASVASGEPEDISEAVVSSASSSRKKIASPAPAAVKQNHSAARRRRSASSKIKSVSKDFETADIPLYASNQETRETLDESKMEKTPVKDVPGKKDKKNNKNKGKKENNGREKVKAAFASVEAQTDAARAASRRSTRASGSAMRTKRMKTVYKIQLFTSEDRLKDNAPCFCGLGPISTFRENNLYKYTYGETENKTEIEALLKEVKPLIPEAFVIQVTKMDDKNKS